MEEFITGKTGSGKPSSVNVPGLLDVDTGSLTVVSAQKPGFNPLDPLPSGIEDVKALAENLVLPPNRQPDPHRSVKADGSPDEV